ncbi:unnamed protein product [Hymenolepis diminuta]|nr:unnamed protein product [Hymenolepis diminuta]
MNGQPPPIPEKSSYEQNIYPRMRKKSKEVSKKEKSGGPKKTKERIKKGIHMIINKEEVCPYPRYVPESYGKTGRMKATVRGKYDWELEGKLGQKVIVMATVFPGWYFCYNESTKKMGIIPAQTVEITEQENYVPAVSANSDYINSASISDDDNTSLQDTLAGVNKLSFLEEPSSDVSITEVKPPYKLPPRPSNYENLQKPTVSIPWFYVDIEYTSDDATVLSAEKGDLLRWNYFTEQQFQDSDDRWLQCMNLKGETGFFPSTYGHMIESHDELLHRLKGFPHALVKSSYSSIDSKEMSVEVGDIVYLISKINQSYSGFKYDGSFGRIPDEVLTIIHPL